MTISHASVAENIFDTILDEFGGDHPLDYYLYSAVEDLAADIYADEGVKLSEDSLSNIKFEFDILWGSGVDHV